MFVDFGPVWVATFGRLVEFGPTLCVKAGPPLVEVGSPGKSDRIGPNLFEFGPSWPIPGQFWPNLADAQRIWSNLADPGRACPKLYEAGPKSVEFG